jgi:DNA-binding HxlR family transcriptional regulator
MAEESPADYAVGSPARLALNVLAHRWTLSIVLALKPGPLRFTELRRVVPGVTAQVLTSSLRELERDGIVTRQQFAEVPPRVEYQLTRLGASLCEPARAIRTWADKHGPDVLDARRRHDEVSSREELGR